VTAGVEALAEQTGLSVQIVPHCKHDDMLALHGRARVSIGLSMSDGISTSFLEAMILGSFPVQTYTACADEWVVDGKSGLLVPPEDPEAIARAIRRAVTDDALVDRAAELNARTAQARLDYETIRKQVIANYVRVWQGRRVSPTQAA
jgi:glycosyltransferase involved in cell wall biosynthesis